MKSKNDFSKGSVLSHIISMAVPMTLAQLINILYNIVDRLYIRGLGDIAFNALTGLGVCLPIVSLITAFANLFGIGGSPLCSIERGKKNNEKAENIIGNSFTMLTVSGIVIFVLCLIFERPLLYLFGASDITYQYASDYFSIYVIGTVFVMISLGMNQYINSQGFAKYGMLTILIGAIINIVLDPLFIYVFNMGVKGAAVATVISQFVSAVWVIKFLTGEKAILKLKIQAMKLKWSICSRIMALGFTGFVMQGTNSLVLILYNSTLQTFGGDLYVGIMTVLTTVHELLRMPVHGINNGAQPVIGFNYGAGEYDRVKKCINIMSIIPFCYTLIAWSLLMLFPEFFIRLFNADPNIIAFGVKPFRIYYCAFIIMFLHYAGQSVSLGLGRAGYAIMFSLLRKVVFVIPLIIILPRTSLGVMGIFLAEPISEVFAGSACYITMRITTRKELQKKISEKIT